MHQRAVALLQLETDIREAVESKQFRLVYLPVVNIATEKISGFEALVRWEHPDRGLVPPNSFVPLAEETGLIVPLGWWILQEACGQMAEWAKRFPGMPELSVSVNLSAKQLRQPDLVDRVAAALADSGLKSEMLKLEIAETVLMDEPDANIEVIQALRDRAATVPRLDHRAEQQPWRAELRDEIVRPEHLTGRRVEGVKLLVRADRKQAPVDQERRRMRTGAEVEVGERRRVGMLPQRFAGGRVQRDDRLLGLPGTLPVAPVSDAVHREQPAVGLDDDRVADTERS